MLTFVAAPVSFGEDRRLGGGLVPVSWGQVEVVVRPPECIILRPDVTGEQPESRDDVGETHRRGWRVV